MPRSSASVKLRLHLAAAVLTTLMANQSPNRVKVWLALATHATAIAPMKLPR